MTVRLVHNSLMKHPSDDQTISTTVFDALRRDIVFCNLKPGEKLKLEALKARYNASVSTLREVLNRLVSERLIETSGQRGFFVAGVSRQELREIADLRILLESHAMDLSFAAGDTEWEGQVVAAHHKLHRMEERMLANDLSAREEWKRYDWEFHQALISACGSASLMAVHGNVFDRYLRYQMLALTFRGAIAVEQHQQLMQAALDRDGARAKEVLRRHIDGGVEDSLAANPPVWAPDP